MDEQKKLYKYICESCGRTIIAQHKRQVIKCRHCLDLERYKRRREKTSSVYRKYRKNADIRKDVKQIETYNKKHGTAYSYGQFKALIHYDKIKSK